MIDYDTLPNPGPVEADRMPRLDLETVLCRRNYGLRNDPRAYWRNIHRYQTRRALGELRYLTGRPTKKRNVPTAYGQQG